MFCRKCGTEIQDRSKFCKKCGTEVILSSEKNRSVENVENKEKIDKKEENKKKNKKGNKKKSNLPLILIILLLLLLGGVGAFIAIKKPYEEWFASSDEKHDKDTKKDLNEDEESEESIKEENEASSHLSDIMRKQVQVTDLTVYYAGDTHMAKADVYLPNYMELLTEFLNEQEISEYDVKSKNKMLKSFANQLEEQAENGNWYTVEIKVDLSRRALEIVSSLDYLENHEAITPDDYKFEENEIIDLIINEAVSEQLRNLLSEYFESIDWGEKGIMPECWEVEQ